ncbi:MAG: activator of (R)-2-hydroxyglutaryl-CoA dehydratase [Bacteroidetes bacterium]|nr:activator of (R)-2-hydroxyglutaryl-CoA dehydratase [Bacteroidota bacterium]
MHDTVRNAGLQQDGDGIDPRIVAALRQGSMTIEEALQQERLRLEREFGLTPRKGHWTRPEERPFKRSERESTTVLFGGLTWKHERLIQANLHRLGYTTAYLPAPDVKAFETGKEFCNNGLCNPTYFTVGNLLSFLQQQEKEGLSRQDIIERYVFFTAGACGPCRFGMYEAEYRLALRNAGYEGFRVLILQQHGGLDQSEGNAGLEMNLDFTLGIINAFIMGDLLNDMAYKLRPYERETGSTDRALQLALEHAAAAIERTPVFRLPEKWKTVPGLRSTHRGIENVGKFFRQLFGGEFVGLMRECREIYSRVRVDRLRVRPVVKITGEFWAQTTEGDGNFRMFDFLEQEGAEVMIEPIAPWLMYLLHQEKQSMRDRRFLDVPRDTPLFARVRPALCSAGRYLRKWTLLTLAEKLYKREYAKLRRVFDDIPQAMPDQYLFQKIAHPYYHSRIEGGEGHLEVAKNIYYTREKLCHMVLSLKPFGCLPSTQSDGVQTAVVAHHEDIIYLPVETSGEGEINAQSRVQMTLNDARERAKEEFRNILDTVSVSEEEIRTEMRRRPELEDPFLRLPGSAAGTAARFAQLVAQLHTGGKH